MPHAALLEDANGGNIGERLRQVYLMGLEWDGLCAEEVHRTDPLVAKVQGKRVHDGEACFERTGREPRPTRCSGVQTLVQDLLAAPVALEARPVLALDLEELHDVHPLRRRGQVLERALFVGEHEADLHREEL